ncbi:hypothetical protein DOTSEDRAFT_126269 [Lecanosticta acicola]|uniref:Uncharacterized protein n=1 Tax=Lecanosticta acicola TaxID=111012 RepID=A0AAI8YWF3_9PEZI|nr:hypothetical protein DOTSEDRAFT_126269 [Lecanosticta acicola]
MTSLAILDDYAHIAPKHFQPLQSKGLLRTVDSFPETLNPTKPEDLQALIERLTPYHIISTMRERTAFPAEVIDRLPNLKLLLSSGTRNAALDLDAFRQRGIPVTATRGDQPATASDDFEPPPPPGYSAVNQHAWALLLSLCGRIPQDDRALKKQKSDFRASSSSWQSGVGISLGGKTLGLLGLGKLGTAFARVAVQSFGMKVIAWSENLTQQKADAAAHGCGFESGEFQVVSKEEVFRRADVLALHLVLSERTRGIVGERELGWMGKKAVLVNTSRGGLIDEEALIETLKKGGIRGVALDVFWEEPLSEDSIWRTVDSWAKSEVVLSPHMGYVHEGTMNRWYQEQAEELERWVRGEEVLKRMV